MAASKGALAAGAARASGERAKRRSTPLVGAEPVILAASSTPAKARATTKKTAAKKTTAAAKRTAAKTTATKATATATKTTATKATATKATQRSASAKAPTATTPAATTPAASTRVKAPTAAAPATRATRKKPRPAAVSPEAVDVTTSPDVVTREAKTPAAVRRPHRPAPKVTSAPSRKVARQSGTRRARPAQGGATSRQAQSRVPAKEKARRDAQTPRPHLRLAEPPIDPTVSTAPTRSGFPLPDSGDVLDALVSMLRLAAESAGISPADVERRVAQVLAYVRRRVEGDYTVDDFGYDADFTANVFYPMLRPIYRHWFRVEVRGIENIPQTGGALVVSNHSGTIAIDSLMVQLAIHDEHPEHRVMRALGADLVFQTPFLGTIARRSGSTLATNSDAERLFAQGELVGVFPEGFKGVGKPFSERYKLQRFGRGGFVAAALSAEVPIVPCSVVGAEEIAPLIGNMGAVARLFGLPYAPITPTFPLLGPLGMIPLPSKWIIEFGAPIPTDGYGAGSAEDPMLVFDLTDRVRETIQQTLYTLLMQRRSVFF
ncbi:MAG: 1-acyl-sn-glycerol-3-phosphate acyltransferase [Ornithinibacter sp.]